MGKVTRMQPVKTSKAAGLCAVLVLIAIAAALRMGRSEETEMPPADAFNASAKSHDPREPRPPNNTPENIEPESVLWDEMEETKDQGVQLGRHLPFDDFDPQRIAHAVTSLMDVSANVEVSAEMRKSLTEYTLSTSKWLLSRDVVDFQDVIQHLGPDTSFSEASPAEIEEYYQGRFSYQVERFGFANDALHLQKGDLEALFVDLSPLRSNAAQVAADLKESFEEKTGLRAGETVFARVSTLFAYEKQGGPMYGEYALNTELLYFDEDAERFRFLVFQTDFITEPVFQIPGLAP